MFGFLRLPHITLRGEGVQMALPVYLLIDTSAPMMGEPITAVTNGIRMLARAWKTDPYLMESAKLSVITFDDQARVVEPLTGIMDFQEPTLQARGSTMMGAGLSLVVDRVKAEVKLRTEEAKGDWPLMLFIITNGAPSDTSEFEQGVIRFAEVKFWQIVACVAGPHANDTILERITKPENIFHFFNADTLSFAAIFTFISKAVYCWGYMIEDDVVDSDKYIFRKGKNDGSVFARLFTD